MKDKIIKLIDLKSIITVALVVALIWGFVVGKVETKDFLVYVSIVITFYFAKKDKILVWKNLVLFAQIVAVIYFLIQRLAR